MRTENFIYSLHTRTMGKTRTCLMVMFIRIKCHEKAAELGFISAAKGKVTEEEEARSKENVCTKIIESGKKVVNV